MANVARGGTKCAIQTNNSGMEAQKVALANLPSYNSKNFANFQPNCTSRQAKRPSVYLPLKDYPTAQTITSEKTNILLRYLHYQTGHKKTAKKRDPSPSDEIPVKRTRPDNSRGLIEEDD